ncbi:manganese efflux pump MntP family protein [Methanoregula sp.]|jgi:putative Mn2+ efflux pump MntP|uniref:manganese efflux pump MntP n=1 Tax=Methanoregula sp. TaxID=2052170 RepID=UPI003C236335
MDFLTFIFIGIGLSMDCFAITLMIGATTKVPPLSAALIIALCFGVFQAGMTMIGWFAGVSLTNFLASFGTLIAFLLLTFIGVKMIIDGFNQDKKSIELIQPLSVIMLSIATSIDALPAGMSFGILQYPVLIPALIIGIVAFTCSFIGVMAGKRFERVFDNKSDIIGGVILILMGIRIFTGILPG